MSRIALYGGAFDPPHLGHVAFLSVLFIASVVDEIWLVPSGTRGDGKSYKTSDSHRIKMLELLKEENFPNESRIRIELIEIEDPTIKGTVELHDALKLCYSAHTFFSACSTELIKDFPQWRHPQRLKSEIEFIVVGRGDHEIPSNDYKLRLINSEPLPDISSTDVREKLARGENVEPLLPPSIYSYVRRYGVY